MGRTLRLLRKARTNPKSLRFDELETLATRCGFRRRAVRSSHRVYDHPDLERPLVFQPGRHSQAKPYQVRQLLRAIDELQEDRDPGPFAGPEENEP